MSLEQKLANLGFTCEDLDSLVHDAANDMASTANNQGMDGQIDFLKIVAGWSEDLILNELRISKD